MSLRDSRPWRLDGRTTVIVDTGPNVRRSVICEVEDTNAFEQNEQRNAALAEQIVREHNEYAELVEAIREAEEMLIRDYRHPAKRRLIERLQITLEKVMP